MVQEGHMNAEERAIRAIIKLMINRKYGPGERLQEAELAGELGMSRTPVRNALRKLSAEGLLDMQPNRGCFIPFLSLEDMQSVFLFRSRLEGFAAELAAKGISEQEIQRLKELVSKENEIYLSSDTETYNKINEKIHLGILQGSGNSYLIRLARPVILRSQLYVFYYDRFCRERKPKAEYVTSPESHHSLIAHSRLVRALEERECEIAKLLAERHILSTLEDLKKAFLIWGAEMFDR